MKDAFGRCLILSHAGFYLEMMDAGDGAVRVLRFDGHRVTVPASVGAADVAPHDVVWERDAPLIQP